MKTIVMLLVAVILVYGGALLFKQYSLQNIKTGGGVKTVVAGKLIVATDATYPPLESVDDKGKIVGFDIDLASEIAKKMGLTLEVKNVSFDKIFDELDNGKVDLIISSVTITPERLAKFAFSSPYFNAGQVLIVNKDSGFRSVTDLRGKKIGAQADTTSLEEALRLTDSGLVASYPDYDLVLKDLSSKKIDALVVDYPAGVGMTQKNDMLKILGEPFTQEFYGVVLKKQNKELLMDVNNIIAELKRTNRLTEIRKIWNL